MYQFDELRLKGRLDAKASRSRAVFAAMIATRLSPAFETYLSKSGLHDGSYFTLLDALWTHLRDESGFETDSHAEMAIALTPSEDDFSVPFAAQAEDAAAALAYALLATGGESAENAAWAARRAYEAVDNLVVSQAGNELLDESAILANPLIQEELREQEADLLASDSEPLTAERISQLYLGARSRGDAFWQRIRDRI